MREISRLLIEVKKMEPTIKYNTEKDKFESPTYAIKMGTYLKQCAEIAIVSTLKIMEDAETVPSAEAEVDLKSLIKITESQWQFEISSQAANDLNTEKWNKITVVPLASDLKLLKDISHSKAILAVTNFNTDGKLSDYIVLLETIFCRVISLNRRHPGELQRL